MQGMIYSGEVFEFTEEGLSVTTAASKLACTATDRDKIELCGDPPFFCNPWSVHRGNGS